MDADRLHLLLNYYPMIGSIIGTLLLIIGLWRKSDKAKRISLWIFLAVAMLAFPVYVSGEINGKEMLSGMFGDAIKQHQAAGQTAFMLIEVAGIGALIGLILSYRKPEYARWFVILVLLLSTVSVFFVTKATLAGRSIKKSPGSLINQQQSLQR